MQKIMKSIILLNCLAGGRSRYLVITFLNLKQKRKKSEKFWRSNYIMRGCKEAYRLDKYIREIVWWKSFFWCEWLWPRRKKKNMRRVKMGKKRKLTLIIVKKVIKEILERVKKKKMECGSGSWIFPFEIAQFFCCIPLLFVSWTDNMKKRPPTATRTAIKCMVRGWCIIFCENFFSVCRTINPMAFSFFFFVYLSSVDSYTNMWMYIRELWRIVTAPKTILKT